LISQFEFGSAQEVFSQFKIPKANRLEATVFSQTFISRTVDSVTVVN